MKFTTNEGQEIDFQVTKVRKKNGKTRLNYLVPTIGINDANGNSLTAANDRLFIITGNNFMSLHNLFEAQYTELALSIDEIAERIRASSHEWM